MSEQLSDREFETPPSASAHQGRDEGSVNEPQGSSSDEVALAAPTKERRRPRRGRRGGRRRKRGRDESTAEGNDEAAEDSHSEERGGGDSEPSSREEPRAKEEGESGVRRKRRGRRGGRRRSAAGDAEASGTRTTQGEPDVESGGNRDGRGLHSQDEARAPRKRGSRGGRRRKKKEPDGAVPIELIPGDDDELPELADLPEDAVLVEASRSSRGSRRGARSTRAAVESDEPEASLRHEPQKKRVILVNARDTEEKRVAVLEEGRIVDLQMTVKKHVSYVNDIYRGRVVNIESAIGAAFVDFGEGRNGFLHASDVLPAYGDSDWSLEKLLSTPVPSAPVAAAEPGAWPDEDKDDLEGAHDEFGASADGDDPDEAHDPDHAGHHHAERHDEEHHEELHHEEHDEVHHEEHEDDDEEGEEEESESQRAVFQRPGRTARAPRRGRPVRHRVRARVPIDKLLKKGQMVAVQITKDAIGDKGPTLTTYISIPGRYLVLMPSLERTGVSRKIDDERERRRLKRILQSLEIPEGMGVIVRTAGIGRTKTEIKRDLDYLLLAWEDFSKRLRAGRNPAPLYQESDVAIRTMRDLFTPETESVSVDDEEVFARMIEFTKRLMPEHIDRVKLHDGPRPLFHSLGVEQDFERIFARRVELPSGGSIVIEQTEALVAIDVNSGRTRAEGAEFEDIALKTNLEAAPEIARQIRLRDLGGIIVLDYIDMMRAGSRKAVERATREALKADRARAKIGRISQFGLLELTRQRLGPGLAKLVYDTCSRCRGSGRRRNASSRAQAIMRRLAAAMALKGFTTVEVRTHPDVVEYMKKELQGELDKFQEKNAREIKMLAVPEQVEDSVLHYLRADGREVRPGGRRRR